MSSSTSSFKSFEGPPYDDKGEIDYADVKEVLIADEDNNQREFDAYNYNKHELNHKVITHKEEGIDRVDVYDNDDMLLDDSDMFGYSYFDTFPSFDSFKINYED